MEELKKLIDVKSITTIVLTIGYVVLTLQGKMSTEYDALYKIIIIFYYGTQHRKTEEKVEELEEKKLKK